MEEETTNEENQPSTSKKDSQMTKSGNDLYDERGHDEGVWNSEASFSATYSTRSQVDMIEARPELPKPALGKSAAKAPERKKRGRRSGKVEKRRRSYNRRQLRRAPMRRKQVRHSRAGERRIREQQSISTIFSRLSSQSGSRTPACVHCGHRCCRRRYEYEMIRYKYTRRRCTCRRHRNRRKRKKKIVRAKKLKKKPGNKFCAPRFPAFSKQIQTGSRSHMLSPLFINTNSTLEAEVIPPAQTYCEVSPEMIFESMSVLNLWKQEVQTVTIMEYIRRNFPVNNVKDELIVELREKLRIASFVGIVTQTKEDCWSLAGELEQRKLTANHVTLFWKLYADTLRPISKREAALQKERLSSDTRKEAEFVDDLI